MENKKQMVFAQTTRCQIRFSTKKSTRLLLRNREKFSYEQFEAETRVTGQRHSQKLNNEAADPLRSRVWPRRTLTKNQFSGRKVKILFIGFTFIVLKTFYSFFFKLRTFDWLTRSTNCNIICIETVQCYNKFSDLTKLMTQTII